MSKIFIISNTNFNISKTLSLKEWQKNMDYYFYNEFIPYLTNNVRPNDILVHLGGFLHKTKSVDLNVLNFTQILFEKIAEILPVYILEGENDSLGLNILKNFKNIEFISEPKEIELLVDQRFAMLPYKTKLDDIDNFDSDYCFFNFDYLNSTKKDIIVSKLRKFKKYYNGFYDKNGIVSNIKNLGAPYNIEGDAKKGFIVLGFVLLLLTFGYLGFKEQVNNYRTVMNEPCKFCEDSKDYQYKNNPTNHLENINLQDINLEP